MYGWCKPRKEFVSRLIDGQIYHFKESDICEFDDLGDLYNVSSRGDIKATPILNMA